MKRVIVPLLLALIGIGCLYCSTVNESEEAEAEAATVETTAKAPADKGSSGAEYGIDISHYNGKIDWGKVSKTPLLFVYIKATEGATFQDKRYKENFEGAKKAGYKVGSYHFFKMTSTPKEQFENFKKHVDRNKQDLIPMIDVETADGHTPQELRKNLNEFIGLVKDYYGVKPMIYGTRRSYNELCGGMYPSYNLYIGKFGPDKPVLFGGSVYTIWQYTEKGSLPGIPKPVDKARFNPKNSMKDILYNPKSHKRK